MRKLIATVLLTAAFGTSVVSSAHADPVPGFESLYAAVFAACTPPAGTSGACEAAINAYSAALVTAGVDPAVALASFTELRSEVVAARGAAQIDAVLEALHPQCGANGPVVSAV